MPSGACATKPGNFSEHCSDRDTITDDKQEARNVGTVTASPLRIRGRTCLPRADPDDLADLMAGSHP